ncbi:methionine--tRNA ligase [Candidatus Pacearchaeota archaeon]|nr:methionine--tRNA ligase [Candidatus Pacearchaeota archaeon]
MVKINKRKFYVTTPIYYPNDIPHIGHAYTTIAADILARWYKLKEYDLFFLTGTDEHGKKMEQTAEKAKRKPKTFVDGLIPEFKNAWQKLNVKYDRFIRTTDSDHEQVVQVILSEVHKNGDIYEGYYEGYYCTACEAYYTEKDLIKDCCPIHKTKIEKLKEESYFFKLSKYQKILLDLYEKNPDFISPRYRSNEIINRVKEGLQDLSISRTSFSWGIPLPFDKKHVCYVWFDALINYLSGIGYLEKSKQFKKYWPADVHLVGKDILWFHAVIWPAILLSLKLPLPRKIFAHGWWTINGEKMSKTSGNVINIEKLISFAGVDSARYFLFRETPFGNDGDFSESALIKRHNTELADKLGNLVTRVSTLAEKYGLEKIKSSKSLDSSKTINKTVKYIENYEFDKALNEIFAFIDKCNEYIQDKKPWESHDKKVIYELSNGIKSISILLSPFMPETADKIAKNFNFEISLKSLGTSLQVVKIKKSDILFKKMEETTTVNKKQSSPHAQAKQENKIPYEDFVKLDLRVGKIIKVEDHPQADKLYVLTVDLGEEKPRTIIAGLRLKYKKEDLNGKLGIFVANLEPAKLRGIESDGMILAAGDNYDSIVILKPEKEVKPGSKIR